MLTKKSWEFQDEKDLQFGGLYSINFEKEEVEIDIQYLAGALISIDGILGVRVSKYELTFTKAPIFRWVEIEPQIMSVIKEMIAKDRKIDLQQRKRMRIDAKGFAKYDMI